MLKNVGQGIPENKKTFGQGGLKEKIQGGIYNED